MKKSILVTLSLSLAFVCSAQSGLPQKPDSIPNFYLGVGTGFDSYTGSLGISANLRVYEKLFIQGGAGLGSWLGKLSLGLRYDLSYYKGWSFGLGFSTASGSPDFEIELETVSGDEEMVTLRLDRAYTMNLKATRFWKSGKRNQLYLDMGYTLPLQSQPWQVNSGQELSNSSRAVVRVMAPGGILLGFGYNFGL